MRAADDRGPGLQAAFPARPESLSAIRHHLQHTLGGEIDDMHLGAIQSVATELAANLLEPDSADPVVVDVRLFRLLTNVRVKHARATPATSEAFSLREQVLSALTIAFGERHLPDGTVELWAEIRRP